MHTLLTFIDSFVHLILISFLFSNIYITAIYCPDNPPTMVYELTPDREELTAYGGDCGKVSAVVYCCFKHLQMIVAVLYLSSKLTPTLQFNFTWSICSAVFYLLGRCLLRILDGGIATPAVVWILPRSAASVGMVQQGWFCRIHHLLIGCKLQRLWYREFWWDRHWFGRCLCCGSDIHCQSHSRTQDLQLQHWGRTESQHGRFRQLLNFRN